MTFYWPLLTNNRSRPRIGYARLLVLKNEEMVVNSADILDVITLGNTLEP